MAIKSEGYATVIVKGGDYERILRNLRHAYEQLAAGTVIDQKQFADGLISPAIQTLERASK